MYTTVILISKRLVSVGWSLLETRNKRKREREEKNETKRRGRARREEVKEAKLEEKAIKD